MLITLIKPLSLFYKIKPLPFNQSYLNFNNLKIERPTDDRFSLFNYRKELINLSHSQQIKLMIVNNSAHKLYLSNKLQYSNIISYIMNEISNKTDNINLNSFSSILKFIKSNNDLYMTNV